VDLLHHLYERVPGLYEYGITPTTLSFLFKPPVQNSIAARNYKGIVNARKATRSNNFRPITEGTHFGRAEQNLITEFVHSFGQLLLSGDDMNIIQVGRSAVSRYHQNNKFYAEGQGPDYAVHDFPNAKYGIKLGGFMVRGGLNLVETPKAKYFPF
jgi:hypothetical protein